MSFKVGDKVIVTGNNVSHGFFIGETVLLQDCDADNVWYACNQYHLGWLITENEFELTFKATPGENCVF